MICTVDKPTAIEILYVCCYDAGCYAIYIIYMKFSQWKHDIVGTGVISDEQQYYDQLT